jgi:NDP-sugar pyrophosphorylase family protein
MKRDIIIIGCGEHAQTAIDNIEQQNLYNIHGLVTNVESELNNEVYGYKVVCMENDLESYLSAHPEIKGYFLGVGVRSGNMKLRYNIYSRIDQLLEAVNIIHPTAVISKYAKIGKGNIFEAYTKVANNAIVGNHCIIYTFTSINHDQEVGDNVLIGCNVAMAGKRVGKQKESAMIIKHQ